MTTATSLTSMKSEKNSNFLGPVAGEVSTPFMSGAELWQALGYRTAGAFSQAARRGTTPVRVFGIPGRRGKHALRADVMNWTTQLLQTAEGTPVTETIR